MHFCDVTGKGDGARFNDWGIGCGSSGYRSSMSASAISIGEGVVVGGTPGERAIKTFKWVGVGDSNICGRLPVFMSGYDGSDVDEVSLDDAVGVNEGGVICPSSNGGGAVGYGVVGPVDASEYSDIVRLFDIGGGAGDE